MGQYILGREFNIRGIEMGKLWEPDERYKYNRNNKYIKNNKYNRNNRGKIKKIIWQSLVSLLIFLIVWGIFQFNGTFMASTQNRIRGWFTEDYDIQPVIKLFSDIGLWGDTIDRAAYEASDVVEPGPLVIPVSGQILKNKNMNNGIAIIAQDGTMVKAAHKGIITRIANEEGLGRIVEITGDNGFVTRYAHLKEILVSLGDKITAGQVIAKVGSTGEVEKPQLFFQIIREGEYVDPANVFIKDEKI